MIKANLYQSSGNVLTNFAEKLPAIQGKLAQEIVKDTYDFGFVSLPIGYDEEELEDALEQNITRFLLELGSGFAFIGRQKEIIVAGKTRKIVCIIRSRWLRCTCNLLSAWSRFFCAIKDFGGDVYGTDTSD